MTNFQDLGLGSLILKALHAADITTPTPIQARAIPAVLEGRDVLGLAQTGTGKTAAFVLPLMHNLLAERATRPAPRTAHTLIIAPTRELAAQIETAIRTFGRHAGLSVAIVFGGRPKRPQAQVLSRGVDILVATPGRLLDHVRERNLDLRSTRAIVLDEADQLLDLGFQKPIDEICSYLPQQRQTLLFSATMPPAISALASRMLRDPVSIAIKPQSTSADNVAQEAIFVGGTSKFSVLKQVLARPDLTRAIIFARTKRGADRLAQSLNQDGIEACAIHGDKDQRDRLRALNSFRDGRVALLVATDIAARGIDVDDVSHVINYDLPEKTESYVHRIGRTARAGNTGVAITLCFDDDANALKQIERLTSSRIASVDAAGAPVTRYEPQGDAEGRGRRQKSRSGRGPSAGGSGTGKATGTDNRQRRPYAPRSSSPHQRRDEGGRRSAHSDAARRS
ncbi:MAG: DEAD/DEAH box helicase [Hyphomicrobiaceae bacterium]